MARDTNTRPKTGDDGGIQSVARALSILELFDERRSSLTTNEIAALTELNRGTAYRFCQTLSRLGYLEEIHQSTFRPGLKVLSLAQAALIGRELVDIAMPHLQALRHDTGETVNMAMRDGPEVVYVARLLNDDLLALRLVVGSRLPIGASSLGRAILAFLPDDQVGPLLDVQVPELTPFTITDRKVLAKQLETIRRDGFAVNDQEVAVGVRGVAVPILSDGRPVAAINVSVARPVEEAELTEMVPLLKRAASDIGERARRIDRFDAK